jgi:hypothetical protein
MTAAHIRLERPGDEEVSGYGYGLYVRHDGERLVDFRHSGGVVGYVSLMAADPDHDFGIVGMANGGCNLDAIVDYALGALSAASTGAELPDVPEPRDRFAVSGPSAYTGSWESPDGLLVVEADGSELWLRSGGVRARLEPRGRSGFIVHDQHFERFLLRTQRDNDARVVGWTHGARAWGEVGVDGESPNVPPEWRAYPGHYRNHNPWFTNFRVVLRGASLLLIWPGGRELVLLPRDDGSFQVGEGMPETLRFDTVVDGEAWRATFGGSDAYYRFFTP